MSSRLSSTAQTQSGVTKRLHLHVHNLLTPLTHTLVLLTACCTVTGAPAAGDLLVCLPDTRVPCLPVEPNALPGNVPAAPPALRLHLRAAAQGSIAGGGAGARLLPKQGRGLPAFIQDLAQAA